MADYLYKGFTITFNELRGDFRALCVNGVNVSAPSLPAIKKKIDKILVVAFKPFKAISINFDDPSPFKVLRITDDSGFRHSRGYKVFVTDREGYSSTLKRVTLDTPENRNLIKEWRRAQKEHDKLVTASKAKCDAALKAIPMINADTYNPTADHAKT